MPLMRQPASVQLSWGGCVAGCLHECHVLSLCICPPYLGRTGFIAIKIRSASRKGSARSRLSSAAGGMPRASASMHVTGSVLRVKSSARKEVSWWCLTHVISLSTLRSDLRAVTVGPEVTVGMGGGGSAYLCQCFLPVAVLCLEAAMIRLQL